MYHFKKFDFIQKNLKFVKLENKNSSKCNECKHTSTIFIYLSEKMFWTKIFFAGAIFLNSYFANLRFFMKSQFCKMIHCR